MLKAFGAGAVTPDQRQPARPRRPWKSGLAAWELVGAGFACSPAAFQANLAQ